MHGIRPLTRAMAVALAVAGCLLATDGADAATTTTQPIWASARSATIHPGVSVQVGNSPVCRAGFIFTDGTHAFIAIPASCAGTGPADNSKCDVGQDPIGTPATIGGAKYKGKFVYSSLVTMVLRGQTHKVNRCSFNDLALVRIDPRDIKRTNPSVPVLGGPAGVSQDQPAAPDQLSVYLTTASNAQALDTSGGGWSHAMMVDGPVAGSDLGGPVLTDNGKGLGMVSGLPTSNGRTLVNDLYREVRYLRTVKKFEDVHLAKGTVKFSPMFPVLSSLF